MRRFPFSGLMMLNSLSTRNGFTPNLVGIKYDTTTLPMIASSKIDNAKMSADLKKDLDRFKAGKA